MSNKVKGERCPRCGDALDHSGKRVKCVGCDRMPGVCDCPKDARRGA